MEEKLLKTGTTTIGIVCKDGIVLAADKRASAGYLIAHRKQEKIQKISDDMAVTQAGLVSDAQLLTKVIKAQLRLEELKRKRKPSVKEAANLLAGLLYQNIRQMSMVPGIVGFLLAGVDRAGFHLYDLGIDGSATSLDDFGSTGSGSLVAYGVLETLYKKGLDINEGVKLALKAINAAIKRDMPTGDGVDIFTITRRGVKKIFTKEIDISIK